MRTELRRAISALGIVLAVLVPAAGAAQYPRARIGQFEVRGMDFSADGAWRKRVGSIRATRHQFIKAGSIRSLNLSSATAFGGVKVTGHVVVPVIPIAFLNVAPPFSAAQLSTQLFSSAPVGTPYSLKTYYEQLSNNNITLDGRVFPWVTADSADTYYEDGCNGIGVLSPCAHGGARLGEMLLQALSVASNGSDAATVWAPFDNDGPDGIANSGDDDGMVDFVTFVQADKDGACGTPHIWAHRFVVAAYNGGSPYVTQTPWAGHPGQFIKVNDYTMQSAVGGPTACDGSQIMPIGTVAHETGHAFGLPDLYDTTDGLYTEGIGEWGLMGSGNYALPFSPSRMEAWSMVELGWVGVDSLSASGTIRMDPVSASHRVTFVGIPNTDEYYLLENRQDLESDSAQMNPARGSRSKMPGLLVWHIDQGQVDAHGFQGDNRVNAGTVHGVELLQADGLRNLDQINTSPGSNRGDAGDSYPGSSGNRRLGLSSNPASLDNQSRYTGFVIDSIFQVAPHGQMIFRFTLKQPALFAAAPSGARIRVNGGPVASFTDVFLAGETAVLGADSLQTSADGLSRFEYQSWSDGGTLTHTYVAGAGVDTIIARFGSQYRLTVQLINALPGAVVLTAPPPDADLAAGVFLTGGTPVTLTATAPTGTVFGGWSGDTTASAPSLTLPMNRPYSVNAKFVAQVAVDVNAAANTLLGTGALAPEQTAYLDARGNQNGIYDLGDFLAYVKFSGVSPSAGVMRALLAGPPAQKPGSKGR